MNYSPRFISELHENQIFVFGSNLAGKHLGGAARQAHQKWNAVWGQAEGLQGQCYAIPTVNELVKGTLAVEKIKIYVDRFLDFAAKHPELEFLVTEIGCGIAGQKLEDISPLFKEALNLENVFLPERFIEELSKLP